LFELIDDLKQCNNGDEEDVNGKIVGCIRVEVNFVFSFFKLRALVTLKFFIMVEEKHIRVHEELVHSLLPLLVLPFSICFLSKSRRKRPKPANGSFDKSMMVIDFIIYELIDAFSIFSLLLPKELEVCGRCYTAMLSHS